MGKQPAFQFYPGDWFREPGLRASSIGAKGAWAQILFSLHDAKEKGKLSGDLEYWGNLIGVKSWGEWEQHGSYMCTPWTKDSDSSKDTALSLIRELVEKEVCNIKFKDEISRQIFYDEFKGTDNGVTARSCNVTIINRRMHRQFLESERKRKNQQNYRDRQKIKTRKKESYRNVTDKSDRNVTAYSSSSSSITPPTPPKKGGDRVSKKRQKKKFYPPWIDLDLWDDFIKYRKTINAPLTDRAEKILMTELEKLINAKQGSQKGIIEQTIASGKWKGFYPVRNKDDPNPVFIPYKPPDIPEEHDRISSEDIRETLQTLRKGGLMK